MPYPVSKQRFAELVEQALAELPEPFASHLEEVPVVIQDRPTPRQLAQAGLEADDGLLGLYSGVPFTERSVEHSGRLPERIFIFQKDIEAFSRNEAELVRQVRITVLHELGHHFGMDEQDLDELGYG